MSLFGKLFGKKKKKHHKPKCNEPEPCTPKCNDPEPCCESKWSKPDCEAFDPCESGKHDYCDCDCKPHKREDE